MDERERSVGEGSELLMEGECDVLQEGAMWEAVIGDARVLPIALGI